MISVLLAMPKRPQANNHHTLDTHTDAFNAGTDMLSGISDGI